MSWSVLSEPWKVAFEQAIWAYIQNEAPPIGAVVLDSQGEIVSKGACNFLSDRLAHAETQALSAIPANVDRKSASIYSTLEPCPMCTGAIRVCQLSHLHFAAKDPSAGFSDYLDANHFMREFPCTVHLPENSVLEFVQIALTVEFRSRTGHNRWADSWTRYDPVAAQYGRELCKREKFRKWSDSSTTAESIYEQVSEQAPSA